MKKPKPSKPPNNASPLTKWGPILGVSFCALPDAIYKFQHKLGLKGDSTAFNVLTQIISSYKYSDQPVFPGYDKLAERMECSTKTIQRMTELLVNLELIEREPYRRGYQYTFNGLRSKLEPLVIAEQKQKEEDRKQNNVYSMRRWRMKSSTS